MTTRNLHQILDHLRALPAETEWVEFKEKKATFDVDELGKYFCALANEANLKNQPQAWLVLGVHDKKRDGTTGKRVVVGTTWRHGSAALNELKKLIADHTPYRATFRDIHELTVDGLRVLMFEIPPAPQGVPITWKGHLFGREGESLGSLSIAELDQIRGQNTDWSAEVVSAATHADLDPAALQVARMNFKVKHPQLVDEIDQWDNVTFLNKAKVTRSGAITRAAILLLGRPEAAHLLSPADARITWVLKLADGSDRDSFHFTPPYITATTQLAARIRNTPYTFMRDSSLFPDQTLQYDTWVLREILHNCVAHQDYSLGGRAVVVEREESLTFINLGSFIPGSLANVIGADSPPDRYRNRFLAQAMVELNMIDTLGSGIPKTFRIQRRRGFPLPDYDFDDGHRVVVTLTGKILDENYTRALLGKTDIPLSDVVALDRVQKKRPITDEEFRSLKSKKLVEGRRPNIYIAATVAAAAGQQASYVLNAGFDDPYYKDLILKLIDKFQGATPRQIKQALSPKLPDVLDEQQRSNKVRNLVQDLARTGIIENAGKHGPGAKWVRVVTTG